MITEPTKQWLAAISKPIPKGRKNQTIGQRQVFCHQALQAEIKQSKSLFNRAKKFMGIR